jgi:hypothetical protein
MATPLSYPNLPGTYQSGPFRLRLNKFDGRQDIALIYRDKVVAAFTPDELADLEAVVRRMALFVTDERLPTVPPEEG